jgi:hypothetical protein
MYLKILGNQEQASPKISIWKEIIKIGTEINEMEAKRTIKIINEMNSWVFEKINKIDKSLTKVTKKKRGKRPKFVKLELRRE